MRYVALVALLAAEKSSGVSARDDCCWAKAVVWPFAVFASCLWSEPIVSKRSGISPGFRQRLLERAQSANAKRSPLVQSAEHPSVMPLRGSQDPPELL